VVEKTVVSAARYLAKEPEMNWYGIVAREYWARVAPSAVAGLEDPGRFFAELGEQVGARVELARRELEAGLPADLADLELVGRLGAIKTRAEEIALAELVYWVAPEVDLAGELEVMLGGLPGLTQVWEALDGIAGEAEYQAAADGQAEVALNAGQRARWDQLNRLAAVLAGVPGDPGVLTAPEVSGLVTTLREFWDPGTGSLRRVWE
jgi:hypothetical protein